MPVTKTVKMLVAEAKQQTNSISPGNAHDQQQKGGTILIDIRDIRELQRDGHRVVIPEYHGYQSKWYHLSAAGHARCLG